MPFYFYGYDPTYFLVIIALVIGMIAQGRVQSTYKKFSRVRSVRGLTGQAAARQILDANGLNHVEIQQVGGHLSDHFDPRANVLRLSQGVYGSDSVAALGIAAHEAGHAVQFARKYKLLAFRNALVPVANIGSYAAFPLVIMGLLFSSFSSLIWIGVWLYVAVVLFHLVTLPVEFNASRRAMEALEGGGLLYGEEADGARKVLRAAAMTYVAATLAAVLQLMRLVFIARRND